MTLNPFLFGIGPAFLGIVVACCVLLGFPIYFWVAEQHRRGEPVSVLGLIGPIAIGLLGVGAVCLFLLSRR